MGGDGSDSAFGLLLDPENAGGGPQNVGPHVDHDIPPDDAVRDVEAAGGAIVKAASTPRRPLRRIKDPDGNEIWMLAFGGSSGGALAPLGVVMQALPVAAPPRPNRYTVERGADRGDV